MTDLLKKLHAELTDLLGLNDKEEIVTKNKSSRDIQKEIDDEDKVEGTPLKKKKVVEDEDEEEAAPVKKKSKGTTLTQVKAKLKELLDEKGRDAAVSVLEEFDDAEKVGDIDEDDYDKFIEACQTELDKPTKKKKKVVEEDEDE